MARKAFFISPKLVVRATKNKGRGVFALEPMARGEVIEVSPVLLIPARESEEFFASFVAHYMFETDTGKRFAIGLGYTSLYNHSKTANAEFSVSKTALKINTIRAVKAGDEVTVRYGWTHREWAAVGGRID